MNKDLYDKLDFKEKAVYDEFVDFSKKLIDRVDVLTLVMKKLLEVATTDP